MAETEDAYAEEDDEEEYEGGLPEAGVPWLLAEVPRRFVALRAISGALQVLGWIVLVGGSLSSVIVGVAASSDESVEGVGGAIVIIAGIAVSAVYGIMLLAAAEIILLLVDVERNTRATAVATLEQQDLDE